MLPSSVPSGRCTGAVVDRACAPSSIPRPDRPASPHRAPRVAGRNDDRLAISREPCLSPSQIDGVSRSEPGRRPREDDEVAPRAPPWSARRSSPRGHQHVRGLSPTFVVVTVSPLREGACVVCATGSRPRREVSPPDSPSLGVGDEGGGCEEPRARRAVAKRVPYAPGSLNMVVRSHSEQVRGGEGSFLLSRDLEGPVSHPSP